MGKRYGWDCHCEPAILWRFTDPMSKLDDGRVNVIAVHDIHSWDYLPYSSPFYGMVT
ncbi:hypothetical protein [Peribacillus simplex]|uniref:hypothetical protein n=1 Tax=Peribacillus simplex TaxID=1478 RepID=UPI003D29E4A2